MNYFRFSFSCLSVLAPLPSVSLHTNTNEMVIVVRLLGQQCGTVPAQLLSSPTDHRATSDVRTKGIKNSLRYTYPV